VKEYRFETDEGSASLADLFRGRSQLLVYHFMFGPDYTAGCPSCSAIADGFDGFVVHLANHDVTLSAVSRASLAKLQAYKRRMGWTFPWASSLGGDFNFDFQAAYTEEQQREGVVEYNYRRGGHAMDATPVPGPVAELAAMAGTDAATYTRERPGMSAFVLEDGVVYHTIPPMRADWTASGACSSGSTAHPRGATRRASGGAATTSTTRAERSRGCRGATAGLEISRRMASERASQQAFFGASALLFAASAAVTIVWCASMSAMGEMPMPGGWTMSMAWMRMPGQTWPGAAASFLGMWVVMMVAMMLPSLVPMLWRYRQAVGRTGETPRSADRARGRGVLLRLDRVRNGRFSAGRRAGGHRDAAAGAGARRTDRRRCGRPDRGSLQLTEWKARHLACYREAPGRVRTLPADAGTAWRHGLRLGLHCSHCCAGLMAILLVIGVMDLRAAVVAAAITIERLAPAGERVARTIGAVVVGAGLFLIARAARVWLQGAEGDRA
jgi:predicted dithiol-disulfide oxidoreductase (DUF899 family)/predicted metal-binding membrane protein